MSAKLNLFVPITKVDAENRIVYGTAVKQELDRSGETFHYASSKPYFEAWSGNIAKATEGKSQGNLRAMHGKVAAGKVTELGYDDTAEKIEAAAKVVDDNEWTKVLEGVYSGFSIGGKYVKRWTEGKGDDAVKYYTADPAEISLVDYPCGPSATFEVIKAEGTTETKHFREPDPVELKARELCKAVGADPDEEVEIGGGLVWKWNEFVSAARDAIAKAAEPAKTETAIETPEPSNDAVAAKAREMAKTAGDEKRWPEFIAAARVDLKKVAAETQPEPVPVIKVDPATPGGDQWEQVWVHPRLPGKTFTKKDELRAALTEIDAQGVAKTAAAPLLDAMGDLSKLLDAKDGGVEQQAIADYLMQEARTLDAAIFKAGEIDKPEAEKITAFIKANPEHDAVKALKASGAIHLRKDGTVIKVDDGVPAALKAIGAAAARVRKKAYTDAQKAEMVKAGQALPDGSLPIADKGDLEDAIAAYGNVKKGRTAARRHIVKRARNLAALDMLPADWPRSQKDAEKFADTALAKATPDNLRKAATLSSVTNLLYLLADLDRAEEALESPQIVDPYYSPYTISSTSIDVPKALRDQFGKLVVDLGDCVAALLDTLLDAIREEEAGEALEMAAPVISLMKAGARHSKGDTALLKDIHDASVKLGAACEGGADKSEAVADLTKKLEAERGEFTKMVGGLVDMVKSVGARLKAIEDQPVPRPGGGDLRVVEKVSDSTITPLISPDAEKLLSDPAVMSALAMQAVKMAHKSPNTLLGSRGGS